MAMGTVKWSDVIKGAGFIQPGDESSDALGSGKSSAANFRAVGRAMPGGARRSGTAAPAALAG